MTATCAATYGDAEVCARPATRRVTVVCVHEHIRPDVSMCGEHREAEGHCRRCYEGPSPHLCPLTFAAEVGQ